MITNTRIRTIKNYSDRFGIRGTVTLVDVTSQVEFDIGFTPSALNKLMVNYVSPDLRAPTKRNKEVIEQAKIAMANELGIQRSDIL